MSSSVPHIPEAYNTTVDAGVWFHFSDDEANAHKRLVMGWVQDARCAVMQQLNVPLSRRLHVCCYQSMEDSLRGLDRHVPATMAMAPFSSKESCLIIIHSLTLDSRNGNPHRMRRLLVHELVHQIAAEVTASTKLLGDGNVNMRLSSWLNEGIAEVIGLRAIGATDRLLETVQAFRSADRFQPFDRLSCRLDDLDDSIRSEAFVHVTGAVHLLCCALTPCGVIRQLLQIDRFFLGHTLCTPEGMAEYQGVLDHSSDT